MNIGLGANDYAKGARPMYRRRSKDTPFFLSRRPASKPSSLPGAQRSSRAPAQARGWGGLGRGKGLIRQVGRLGDDRSFGPVANPEHAQEARCVDLGGSLRDLQHTSYFLV